MFYRLRALGTAFLVPNHWSWQHLFPGLTSASLNKLLMQRFPWTCLTLTFTHLNMKGVTAWKCSLSSTQCFSKILRPPNRVEAEPICGWSGMALRSLMGSKAGPEIKTGPASSALLFINRKVEFWDAAIAGSNTMCILILFADALTERILCVAYLEFSVVPMWICQVDHISFK